MWLVQRVLWTAADLFTIRLRSATCLPYLPADLETAALPRQWLSEFATAQTFPGAFRVSEFRGGNAGNANFAWSRNRIIGDRSVDVPSPLLRRTFKSIQLFMRDSRARPPAENAVLLPIYSLLVRPDLSTSKLSRTWNSTMLLECPFSCLDIAIHFVMRDFDNW